MKKIGLLAGVGRLPVECARRKIPGLLFWYFFHVAWPFLRNLKPRHNGDAEGAFVHRQDDLRGRRLPVGTPARRALGSR